MQQRGFLAGKSKRRAALIRPQEVNHAVARGGDDQDLPTETARAIAISDIFKRRELLIFLVSVVLFHFGNAAMLPMAGQVLAKTHPGADIIALSACIITAPLVVTCN